MVTISAMSAAWSPMRSISVIIFSALDTSRRSRATGCCMRISLRHRASMSRSLRSTAASCSITLRATALSLVLISWQAVSMASSIMLPIRIISSLSVFSCSSKWLRINQTSL